MDTIDLKLAQDCEALAVSASEGVGWLKNAAAQSPTVLDVAKLNPKNSRSAENNG